MKMKNRLTIYLICPFVILSVDTERIYSLVTETILKPYGKTFDFEIKAQMMGRTALEAGKLLVDATGIPMSAEEYVEMRDRMHMEYFPQCEMMPGMCRFRCFFGK